MKILAIDTATSSCSAALWKDGGVCAGRIEPMRHGQSESLMGMVCDVLSKAECGFAELNLIAVTVGPGAFTGLRIGLAAARGLALSLDLPCFGVTTLEAVAHGVGEDERAGKILMAALETRRDDIYAQTFNADLEALTLPQAVRPDDLFRLAPACGTVIVGDARSRAAAALAAAGVEASLSAAPGVPDAATVCRIAAKRWRPKDRMDAPAPLYLRPPDVTFPKDDGRRRA